MRAQSAADNGKLLKMFVVVVYDVHVGSKFSCHFLLYGNVKSSSQDICPEREYYLANIRIGYAQQRMSHVTEPIIAPSLHLTVI